MYYQSINGIHHALEEKVRPEVFYIPFLKCKHNLDCLTWNDVVFFVNSPNDIYLYSASQNQLAKWKSTQAKM